MVAVHLDPRVMGEFAPLEARGFVANPTFVTLWPDARKLAEQLTATVRRVTQATE